jgi:hypothetical protein
VPRLKRTAPNVDLETAYCAEVVAFTYQAMGLLSDRHGPNWYDAGRFWSGDNLKMPDGSRLGEESARIQTAVITTNIVDGRCSCGQWPAPARLACDHAG